MKLAKEITLKNNSQLYLVFIPAYSRYVSLNIKDYYVYSNVKKNVFHYTLMLLHIALFLQKIGFGGRGVCGIVKPAEIWP